MLTGEGQVITMTEKDYGITLPIKIKGAVCEANDKIKLTIKKDFGAEIILEKTFENIQDNTLNFMLTKEESEKLTPRSYIYILDWYRDEVFLCNIVREGLIQIERKG